MNYDDECGKVDVRAEFDPADLADITPEQEQHYNYHRDGSPRCDMARRAFYALHVYRRKHGPEASKALLSRDS